MKPYRILQDLKNGFDSKQLFDTLSQVNNAQLDGLIYADDLVASPRKVKIAESRFDSILQSNLFLHDALNHFSNDTLNLKARMRIKLLKLLHCVEKYRKLDRFRSKNRSIHSIDPFFHEVIWRSYFSAVLPSTEKERMAKYEYRYSNLTTHDVNLATHYRYHLNLDTTGYDFVIFNTAIPVKVSPNTTKIVRYSQGSLEAVKTCKEDSYFVCDSEAAHQALLAAYPELKTKSSVIPPLATAEWQNLFRLLRS